MKVLVIILLVLWIGTIIILCINRKHNGVYEHTWVKGFDKSCGPRHCWIKDGIIYIADDKMYCRYDGKNINEVKPGF